MCLSGRITKKRLTRSQAIDGWKIIEKMGDRFVGPYILVGTNFQVGLNTTRHPGFHAYLNRSDAVLWIQRHRCWNNCRMIKVKLYGHVRFGTQSFEGCVADAASATLMEIKSFRALKIGRS